MEHLFQKITKNVHISKVLAISSTHIYVHMWNTFNLCYERETVEI